MALVQIAQHADDLQRASCVLRRPARAAPAATFDPPGLVFFDLGGVRLLLDRARRAPCSTSRVDDIDATVERLRAAGVPVESEPHVIFGHDDDTLGSGRHRRVDGVRHATARATSSASSSTGRAAEEESSAGSCRSRAALIV